MCGAASTSGAPHRLARRRHVCDGAHRRCPSRQVVPDHAARAIWVPVHRWWAAAQVISGLEVCHARHAVRAIRVHRGRAAPQVIWGSAAARPECHYCAGGESSCSHGPRCLSCVRWPWQPQAKQTEAKVYALSPKAGYGDGRCTDVTYTALTYLRCTYQPLLLTYVALTNCVVN